MPMVCTRISKMFKVERETKNKRRLFKTCSINCGYFDWLVNEESSSESSAINEAVNPVAVEEVEDLSNMFDSVARTNEKRDIDISLNMTFHKENGSTEVNGKGKGHT